MYDLIAFSKWCQDLPLSDMARSLKELGFDGVDMPVRPNAPITHENAPEKLSEAVKIFQDNGLKVERLVTALVNTDEHTEPLLEAVREAGISKIRLGSCFVPDNEDPQVLLDTARRNLNSLHKLLKKHGVWGAVQNHSGSYLEVNISSCLRLVQDCDPEVIGIQYDPGHTMISGEPSHLALGLIGPYLHRVNFKSPRKEYTSDPETERLRYRDIWVPLRDGMLDVRNVLSELQKAGYTDPISVHAEYRTHYYVIEKNTDATKRLMAEDVKYLRTLMENT
jgi:sugar phosphate isomerase/epimerase